MPTQTLLSRQEAVLRSELGPKFPQCELSDILQTEEWEFRNCLGWDLYGLMLAQLVDYSAVEAWTNQAYAANAVVRHNGLFWKAKIGTSTEPLVENQYWGLATKFENTTCGALYNEVWCKYMARYLSLKVAKITIPRVAVVATGNGVVRSTANGMIPADANEIKYLIQGIETQSIQVFENMMAWIKRTDNETCFGSFDENCKPISCEKQDLRGCENKKPYTVGVSVY